MIISAIQFFLFYKKNYTIDYRMVIVRYFSNICKIDDSPRIFIYIFFNIVHILFATNDKCNQKVFFNRFKQIMNYIVN